MRSCTRVFRDVAAPALTISDDSGRIVSKERHLKAGSVLRLRCEARDVLESLNESVVWTRGDETLTEDVRWVLVAYCVSHPVPDFGIGSINRHHSPVAYLYRTVALLSERFIHEFYPLHPFIPFVPLRLHYSCINSTVCTFVPSCACMHRLWTECYESFMFADWKILNVRNVDREISEGESSATWDLDFLGDQSIWSIGCTKCVVNEWLTISLEISFETRTPRECRKGIERSNCSKLVLQRFWRKAGF